MTDSDFIAIGIDVFRKSSVERIKKRPRSSGGGHNLTIFLSSGQVIFTETRSHPETQQLINKIIL